MLALYFLITVGSMFFVTAAVGAVTAGFLDNLLKLSLLPFYFKLLPASLLFVICVGILVFGKYSALDGLIKVIGTVMLLTTVIAFGLTLLHGPVEHVPGFLAPEIWNETGFLFLIALMGWMPTAVDMSAWNSLWTIARIKQTGYRPALKKTLLEFNLGYWVAAVLSFCFVTLGAYIIYGTGQEMPNSSSSFANEVVNLYTSTIGKWSYPIIAAAAFSVMFGTSMGVFDGYARALERSSELLFFSPEKAQKLVENRSLYVFSLILIGVGGYVIIWKFGGKLKNLVDLATIISFLIAPVIAIVNFRLVTGKHIAKDAQPSTPMRILSWCGILFLTGFSLFFVIMKLKLM